MRDNRKETAEQGDWALDSGAPERLRETRSGSEPERPFPTKSGILTQAEIEALLRPDLPDDIGLPSEPKSLAPRKTPSFETSDSAPLPEKAEQQAKLLAARLSLSLGQNTGLKAAIRLDGLQSIDTDVLAGLRTGKAGAVACFGQSETETSILVWVPATLADALIAQACGGRSSTGRIGDGWTLSAIDCALLEQLLTPLAAVFGNDLSLLAIETDIPYVTSLLPTGQVLAADYVVEAAGLQTQLSVVSADLQSVATERLPIKPRQHPPVMALLTARIASLSVPISRLTSLKAGSTLLLGLPADQPVEILSGDRDGPLAFEGQVGRKGNKVAVRINRKVHGVLDQVC